MQLFCIMSAVMDTQLCAFVETYLQCTPRKVNVTVCTLKKIARVLEGNSKRNTLIYKLYVNVPYTYAKGMERKEPKLSNVRKQF